MEIALWVSLYTALSVLIVILLSLWVRKKLQVSQKMAYQCAGPNGMESLEAISIGGINQWLHIRGRHKDNPLLLFLHGGPGSPHIGWFDEIQRPWEDYFTVVQWDQRQTGKSYVPLAMLGSTMRNQTMIQDTKQVIQYLQERFNREKLFLVGKSYGSYLGLHIAKQHPEWLYAFVGDGQMINFQEFAYREYNSLFDLARESKDTTMIDTLESIAPRLDKQNLWKSFTAHEGLIIEGLDRYGKGMAPLAYGTTKAFFQALTLRKLISNHLTLRDLYHSYFKTSAIAEPESGFSHEILSIDVPSEIGTEFRVPVFLLSGLHDLHVPLAYQQEWFETVSAPYKEHHVFQNSRHYPYVEEPGKYLLFLVEKLLPISFGSSSVEQTTNRGGNQ